MSESNGYASREEFLAPVGRRYKDVTLPASQRKVRIQSLMEGEKSRYETHVMTRKGEFSVEKLQDAKCLLFVLCMVDKNNHRMLTPEDIPALRKLDGADTSHLYNECRMHCGFEQGDIEGLVKNSETITAAD